MHPDDLRKGKTVMDAGPSRSQPPPPQRSLSSPTKAVPSPTARPTFAPLIAHTASNPSLSLPRSPRVSSKSPPGSRQNSLRGQTQLTESQKELQKYTEKDDENYEDMFDEKPDHGSLSQSIFQCCPRLKNRAASLSRQSLQLMKRSNKSWTSDREDTHDPFAEIDDDFSLGEDDMEAQLLRDKRATLCGNVNRIVDLFEPSTPHTSLREACDELVSHSVEWLLFLLTGISWGCLKVHQRWV